MIEPFDDIYFMKKAFAEALQAFDEGEIPVGAVVVAGNKIIARAHNLTETLNDVTAHAEMQAITAAANHFGGKCLNDARCMLPLNLVPCVPERSDGRKPESWYLTSIPNGAIKISPAPCIQNQSDGRHPGNRCAELLQEFLKEAFQVKFQTLHIV